MKSQFFLVLLMAGAALFTACNADSSGDAEASILDASPRYSISITTEKEEEGSLVNVVNTDGIVTVSPSGRIKAGDTVTLTAHPQLITDDTVETPEYWFVKSIRGSYSMEGGPERTNVSFRPSTSVSNEWTFRMTPGDLTIDVEFTQDPDETTADLSALYASAGAISPDFAKDKTDYTITVPFGTAAFSISAQAENPYLEPVLLPAGGSGGSLLDEDLPLVEGLNEYEITVSSGDKSRTSTYNIDVILLPDLSLKTFKIVNEEKGFERDLAPQDTQTVYLPYADGLTLVAEANDGYAEVTTSPASIPTLSRMSNYTVKVTVSKDLAGVDTKYKSKDYVLNLQYVGDVDLTPLASGGYVSFIPSGTEGFYYEVHTFLNPGDDTLLFSDTSLTEVQADILVVGGGGGAGGNDDGNDRGGGGGAGGLLVQAGQTLTLTDGSVAVTVGEGGPGGAQHTQGTDGGASSIGTIPVPGGGGGGSGNDLNSRIDGKSGGSGGGAGAGGSSSSGNPGTGANGDNDVQGKNGGTAGQNGGGGGGGAGSVGGAASGNYAGAGGAGWKPSGNTGWEWVETVTATDEFSRGGRGGSAAGEAAGVPGVNYGDGGSGSNSYGATGTAGQSGIVIVRFQREYKGEEAGPAE